MKKVRVGIVGAGYVSEAHIKGYINLRDKAEIVAIVDSNKHLAEEKAKKWGIKEYFNSYDKVLSKGYVDAVDICTPHYLHAEMAIKAMEKGKHVLLEKPIATNLKDADKVISKAKKSKVKLMIAENVRFLPCHKLVKKLIDSNEVGRVFLANSHLGGSEIDRLIDQKHWKGTFEKAGGGVLIDSGMHRIDLYRWLLGDIEGVYAWIAKQVIKTKGKCEDTAMVMLRFKNGAIGQISLSWAIVSQWNETLELYGSEGTILVNLLKGYPIALHSSKLEKYSGWIYPFVEHTPTNWWEDSIMREISSFIDCIINDKEPEISGEEGRADLEVALAAYESAFTGKVIKLPIKHKLKYDQKWFNKL